jgi:hypothetical protein
MEFISGYDFEIPSFEISFSLSPALKLVRIKKGFEVSEHKMILMTGITNAVIQ